MLTDPIADMLTRIRNANKALHETAVMPTSRVKEEIARLEAEMKRKNASKSAADMFFKK